MTEIVITMEGGVIQDVLIPKGSNVVVKVMDFDTEGMDTSDYAKLPKNKMGERYVETVWKE